MDPKHQIQINITVDLAEMAMQNDWLDAENVEKWIECAKESAKEFAEDLSQFLEKHPFVKSCKIK